MSDDPYTKRELDFHFSEIKETLARIEAQTIRTNGRVNKCEENISNQKTSGRVANWAFGITVPLIISMSLWIYFYQITQLTLKVDKHIDVADKKLEALNK